MYNIQQDLISSAININRSVVKYSKTLKTGDYFFC